MSFPRGVRGIGKGIGVGFFRRPASSRILPSAITTACCRGYRLGIGHTRQPMKEHLGQPQLVTILRGHAGNYGHVQAMVRALLESLYVGLFFQLTWKLP